MLEEWVAISPWNEQLLPVHDLHSIPMYRRYLLRILPIPHIPHSTPLIHMLEFAVIQGREWVKIIVNQVLKSNTPKRMG